MAASKSILDLMSDEDRKIALKKAEKRLAKRSYKTTDVSPEQYIMAEFGYYFGWDAVVSLRRGYTLGYDDKGNITKDVLTLTEAAVILEGARKVRYSQLIEEANATMAASASKYAKNPGEALDSALSGFKERAKVSE